MATNKTRRLAAAVLPHVDDAGLLDRLLMSADLNEAVLCGTSPTHGISTTALRKASVHVAASAALSATDADLLSRLASDRRKTVRRAVAANPNTPQSVIDQLRTDEFGQDGNKPETDALLRRFLKWRKDPTARSRPYSNRLPDAFDVDSLIVVALRDRNQFDVAWNMGDASMRSQLLQATYRGDAPDGIDWQQLLDSTRPDNAPQTGQDVNDDGYITGEYRSLLTDLLTSDDPITSQLVDRSRTIELPTYEDWDGQLTEQAAHRMFDIAHDEQDNQLFERLLTTSSVLPAGMLDKLAAHAPLDVLATNLERLARYDNRQLSYDQTVTVGRRAADTNPEDETLRGFGRLLKDTVEPLPEDVKLAFLRHGNINTTCSYFAGNYRQQPQTGEFTSLYDNPGTAFDSRRSYWRSSVLPPIDTLDDPDEVRTRISKAITDNGDLGALDNSPAADELIEVLRVRDIAGAAVSHSRNAPMFGRQLQAHLPDPAALDTALSLAAEFDGTFPQLQVAVTAALGTTADTAAA